MKVFVLVKRNFNVFVALFLIITLMSCFGEKNTILYSLFVGISYILFQYILYVYTSRTLILNRCIKPIPFKVLYISSIMMTMLDTSLNIFSFELQQFKDMLNIYWVIIPLIFYVTCFVIIGKNRKSKNNIPCFNEICSIKSCINCTKNKESNMITLIDNELKKHPEYYYTKIPKTFVNLDISNWEISERRDFRRCEIELYRKLNATSEF